MKKDRRLKVTWEQEIDPQAEDRLLRAFEMLFAEPIIISKPSQNAVENSFDKDFLQNNHDSYRQQESENDLPSQEALS
jgi:hypothetical protein